MSRGQQKFIVYDVQPTVELQAYLFEAGDLFEPKSFMQDVTGFVPLRDAGYQSAIAIFATCFNQFLHQERADPFSGMPGRQINGRFQRIAVGSTLFPCMGITITDDFLVLLINEIRER